MWWHGSSEGKLFVDFSTDKGNYDVTFFTPIQQLAQAFANATGAVYGVTISSVKMFDVEDIFIDRTAEDPELTKEGVVFAQTLQKYIGSEDALTIMKKLASAHWAVFDHHPQRKGPSYYAAFRRTLENLGYRGWFEFEADQLTAAMLYPEEDTEILIRPQGIAQKELCEGCFAELTPANRVDSVGFGLCIECDDYCDECGQTFVAAHGHSCDDDD